MTAIEEDTPELVRLYNAQSEAIRRVSSLAERRDERGEVYPATSDDSAYVNGTTFLVDGGITQAYVTPE